MFFSIFREYLWGTGRMDQWVRAFATKPNNLTTSMVEKTKFCLLSSDFYTYARSPTYTNKCNKKIKHVSLDRVSFYWFILFSLCLSACKLTWQQHLIKVFLAYAWKWYLGFSNVSVSVECEYLSPSQQKLSRYGLGDCSKSVNCNGGWQIHI